MRKHNTEFAKKRSCKDAPHMAHYLSNSKIFQLQANTLLHKLMGLK